MLDHLIVDGYNVLYAWNRGGGRHTIAVARETLLRDLELAAATRGLRCTVVFDGRLINDIPHASSAHLEVLFAGPRQSADAVIERLVCRWRQTRPGSDPLGSDPLGTEGTAPPARTIVVTDDHLLSNLAVGWGALGWSTTQLAHWLHENPDC